MDSPGYDPASVTGQIAGGCNLVCFTTGRGSAFGSKPAPTIKLATNSEMYGRMKGKHIGMFALYICDDCGGDGD